MNNTLPKPPKPWQDRMESDGYGRTLEKAVQHMQDEIVEWHKLYLSLYDRQDSGSVTN